ncbi:hypothetical protein GLOIN_2v1849317 [Rhizophagus irregularis DAOM 181602=DAOM 197198]|nr:hypothetical protein GLOIN_2v1849317 [Rhizophagus irregularis DAOM 181602=DAOM 197198]
MLQRAPRIYRLLEVANFDWRLLDSFEELSACFFKSGKEIGENKRIKIEIIKEYFDISGVNFDEMVGNE